MALWRKLTLNRRIQKISGDLLLIASAYYLAFYLRFDGHILPRYSEILLHSLPLVMLAKIALLHYYRLHDTYWRYTSLKELIDLITAVSLAELYVIVSYWVTEGFGGFPRSVFILDWFFSLVFLAGFRAMPRLLYEFGSGRTIGRPFRNGWKRSKEKETVLLYGAGHLGATLARQIREIYPEQKRVLGFIDDDLRLAKARIHGIEVLGGADKLEELAGKKQIDEIIITISAISGQRLQEIVEFCRRFAQKVRIAPGLHEVFEGRVRISDLRDFQIEDLLGREEADMNEDLLLNFLEGKTVLLTGAGGSIGSELCFQILRFRPRLLLLLGRGENSIYQVRNRLDPYARPGQLKEIIGDIINYPKFERILARYRPQVIFHAGADKHVPLMESNPDEAVLNNIVGTQSVLRAALKWGVQKVVCVSSDKAVNPTSVMGCCKRVAELLVPQYNGEGTVACTVRFGNVLGSRGSVIPLFRSQIAKGGPVTITHPDMTRYFMTIPEAVLLVLKAGAVSRGGEIFILDMGEPIKIVDLARQMIRLSGLDQESMPIEFVGLRAGEKLHEELTYEYETLEATKIPKLHRATIARRVSSDQTTSEVVSQGWHLNTERLNALVERLRWLAIEMDFAGIQRKLREIVPEYRPISQYPESPKVQASRSHQKIV